MKYLKSIVSAPILLSSNNCTDDVAHKEEAIVKQRDTDEHHRRAFTFIITNSLPSYNLTPGPLQSHTYNLLNVIKRSAIEVPTQILRNTQYHQKTSPQLQDEYPSNLRHTHVTATVRNTLETTIIFFLSILITKLTS